MRTESCCYRNYEMKEKKENKEAKDIRLKCGSGSVGPLPIIDATTPLNPIPVGSVTVDTTCMDNPAVLVTAVMNIFVPAGALPVLIFQLVKTCNGESIPVGGSYTFTTLATTAGTSSYTIQYCDCGDCTCCGVYSLEIVSASTTVANLTINANLSALAVEK